MVWHLRRLPGAEYQKLYEIQIENKIKSLSVGQEHIKNIHKFCKNLSVTGNVISKRGKQKQCRSQHEDRECSGSLVFVKRSVDVGSGKPSCAKLEYARPLWILRDSPTFGRAKQDLFLTHSGLKLIAWVLPWTDMTYNTKTLYVQHAPLRPRDAFFCLPLYRFKLLNAGESGIIMPPQTFHRLVLRRGF